MEFGFKKYSTVRHPTMLQSLVVALVLSRLDYGSTVLFWLPQQLVDKLQSVQKAAARLVLAARRRDHISPLLQIFTGGRWTNYIQVGGAVPLPPWFSTRLYTCPANCSESLMSARGGDFVPRRPLHWSFYGLFEPPSVTGLSLLPRLQFGTAFRKQSVLQHLWPCSESQWKRNFSRDPAL